MLFRKKIARSCAYCVRGTKLNKDDVLCAKRGIVSAQSSCRKFSYDPCRRIPQKQKTSDFSQYTPEDFSL